MLGVMRGPADVAITDYNTYEYCGKKTISWCHMREKQVCDTHRYFTQGVRIEVVLNPVTQSVTGRTLRKLNTCDFNVPYTGGSND
jgi:hypothetical protein